MITEEQLSRFRNILRGEMGRPADDGEVNEIMNAIQTIEEERARWEADFEKKALAYAAVYEELTEAKRALERGRETLHKVISDKTDQQARSADRRRLYAREVLRQLFPNLLLAEDSTDPRIDTVAGLIAQYEVKT